jgi:hypothetical protein
LVVVDEPVEGLVLLGLVLLGLVLEPVLPAELPPIEPLELPPTPVLPVLLPLELLPWVCASRRQSSFCVPVRASHLLVSLELAPALLLGLLVESLVLGLLLEPALLLGLLLEPVLLDDDGELLMLGLELEPELAPVSLLALPVACATPERPNSAAATAAPSNFMFIVSLLKGLRDGTAQFIEQSPCPLPAGRSPAS